MAWHNQTGVYMLRQLLRHFLLFINTAVIPTGIDLRPPLRQGELETASEALFSLDAGTRRLPTSRGIWYDTIVSVRVVDGQHAIIEKLINY